MKINRFHFTYASKTNSQGIENDTISSKMSSDHPQIFIADSLSNKEQIHLPKVLQNAITDF